MSPTRAPVPAAARARGITLLGPPRPDPSPQARTGGYTVEAFTIDWDNQQVTCPQGQHSSRWLPVAPNKGRSRPGISVRFSATTCAGCPVRDRCTTVKNRGRQLTLNPRPIHEALLAARAEQATNTWRQHYKARAGIEGTIAQATHITGIRTARYTGLAKIRLEHTLAATAINMLRLDAWWTDSPFHHTRATHLHRLHCALAA